MQSDPYVMESDDNDTDTDYEGFVVDILDGIAEKLDFTYELELVEDLKYGALQEDGQWDGMVGALVDQVSHQCDGVQLLYCSDIDGKVTISQMYV